MSLAAGAVRGVRRSMPRATPALATLLGTLVLALALTGTPGAAGAPGSAPDTSAMVTLGRLLFWDPVLSGARDTACATCHHPDFAWADGRELSLGTDSAGLGPGRVDLSRGRIPVVRRNSQTILNTAFNGARGRGRRGGARFDGTLASVDQTRAPMFWDSRVRSLETQALEPLKALEEMRGEAYADDEILDVVAARLRAIPEYVDLFHRAFGAVTITPDQIGQAIAAFERTLVAMNSPFDRFQAGDRTALTDQQRRGLQAFNDVGCARCHGGPMFSDFSLQAEGVAEHPLVTKADAGDGRFRFRTPTLRNVALTAPYMHNGTLATLEDVMTFYDEGRSRNLNIARNGGDDDSDAGGAARLSGRFRRVDDMSAAEQADIIAFLEALSDPVFERTVPARVPSGLPPGGTIAAP
jgi:cytochrome c peroxidase